MKPPCITFFKKDWPDVTTAMDSLFGLFEDHYPYVSAETEEAWLLGLNWPVDPLWYVDPKVREQARRVFDLSLEELPALCEVRKRRGVPFVFSMFHSRALLAVAAAFETSGTGVFSHIVHVDDHNDLMPCLAVPEKGILRDTAFGVMIDIDDFQSVRDSIDRGIVNKGNFLTAYLLAKPAGEMVYVNRNLPQSAWWLVPQPQSVVLGDHSVVRTSLAFSEEPVVGTWRLEEVACLPQTLELTESDVIWLDIDMDGFNDRYDGDSDRRNRAGTDQEKRELEDRIETFLSDLSVTNWKSRIGAVSVAASPAFFPSEYWDWAIPKICSGLEQLIGGE
jgi:hypothetical protein